MAASRLTPPVAPDEPPGPPVTIEYRKDIPARDGRREFLKGERYVVTSAAAAKAFHPDATIVGVESGATPESEPLPAIVDETA